MEKLLTDFGVQPVYLAAQIVNFMILLLILKKFLYKPILQVLEDRKKTVSNNLAIAEQIELKLKTTEQESAKKLSDVSKKAKIILENASNTADQIIADAHEKARADVDVMIERGRESIRAERELMKKEMTEELAGLVVLGMERVAGKVLDDPDHQKIVEQALEELEAD